jgi:ankyrin repeat protein
LTDLQTAIPQSFTGKAYAFCGAALLVAVGILCASGPSVPPATIESISLTGISEPAGKTETARDIEHGAANRAGDFQERDQQTVESSTSKDAGNADNRRDKVASSAQAIAHLAFLRREMDRLPFLLNCTVVSDLGDDHYEIAQGSHRAVLRAPMARVVRPGLLEMPVIQSGTMTVKLKNGFESELPLFTQAMSRTGASGLSIQAAIAAREDVNERLRKAQLNVAVAAMLEGFSGADIDSLAMLAGAGADFDQSDLSDVLGILRTASEEGLSPIHVAAREGDAELLKTLIASGQHATVLTRDGISTTNVSVRAHSRRLAVLASLLDELKQEGIDPDQQDRGGRSPIHLAVAMKSEELLRFLANRGMSLNRRDASGSTPVHAAVAVNSDLLGVLLELGADASIQNGNGDTPLHVACRQAKLMTVKTLVQHGLDVNARNRDGQTSLHASAAGSSPDQMNVVRFLLDSGADLAIRDKAGNTAATLTSNERLRSELVVIRTVMISHPAARIEFVPNGLIAAWNERNADTFVARYASKGEHTWQHRFYAETIGHFVVNPAGRSFCITLGHTADSITCLDERGEVAWNTSLPGRIDSVVPDRQGGLRCVVGEKLHCISPSGDHSWEASVGTPLYPCGPTMGQDGTIYLSGEDEDGQDGLVAITASGKRQWCFAPHRGVVQNLMCPVISPGGMAYSVFGNGGTVGAKVFSINQNGQSRWDATVGYAPAVFGAIGNDGTLYLAANGIYAIASDGQKRWHADSSAGIQPLVTQDGTVYAIDGLGELVRYSKEGREQQRIELQTGRIQRARISPNQVIDLIDADGLVVSIDCRLW